MKLWNYQGALIKAHTQYKSNSNWATGHIELKNIKKSILESQDIKKEKQHRSWDHKNRV